MYIATIIITFMLTECYGLSAEFLVREQWEEYKLQYKKMYPTENEDLYRMKVYTKNMHKILQHNKRYAMGETTYKMSMNKFGDLTDVEFSGFYQRSYDAESDNKLRKNFHNYSYINLAVDPPEKIDWRSLGAVTNVKDQGKCGSCYAFSAVGALEAQQYLISKKQVSLSAQNIVDCTYKMKRYPGNSGCRGGRVDSSFKYIINNHGIATDQSYPYVAERQDCEFSPENVGANMSSMVLLPKGNETELKRAVALIGPVSVMVDSKDMRFYSAGIYEDPTCSSNIYDHGMLVVGYDSYKKYDYWLLKNSWGEDWGERGYMMMIRNKNNHCAIATAALYPVV